MFIRRFSSFRLQFKRLDPLKPVFVEKCPLPEYDTGCSYCEPQYPFTKPINHSKSLRSSKASIWKHLLVLDGTHPDHWKSKIELEPGTIPMEVARLKRDIISPYHPILVSNVHLRDTDEAQEKTRMVLFPDNLLIEIPSSYINDENFVRNFIKEFLTPDGGSKSVSENMSVSEFKKKLVLVCGHTNRDVRCGLVAPMILDELEKVLKDKNVGDIEIGSISHIGGHLFAGNVVYFNGHGESIWYGRVSPKHVQGIVNETILGEKIIEELYRG